MQACRLLIFIALVPVLPVLHAADRPVSLTREETDFFEARIRPVLVRHCYECHSMESKKVKGGLRLDHRDGLLAGGETGPAVVPGDLQQSLLINALRYDEGLEMPPSGKLSDEVIRNFETWVKMGAPDPRTASGSTSTATIKPKTLDIEAGRKHWAYQPVKNYAVPAVSDTKWPIEPTDHFILASLEKAEIRPVAEADRYAWLRRVSLDLTGLPPNPEQIRAFVSDRSPEAWARVVDRLLASPAYGERWARHWLDMTGYADQIGTSNNVFAEHAWRYRDYLIDAFNVDKPFDRFISEQIAGDLLPWDTAKQRSDNLVATGFLVLGDVEIVNPDKLQLEADLADLQLTKTGMVFLGQTLGCVRCHDHKFDPIGLEDYYGLAGIFRSTRSVEKIDNGIWSGITVAKLPETAQAKRKRMIAESEHARFLESLRATKANLTDQKTSLENAAAKADTDKDAVKKMVDELGRKMRGVDRRTRHAEFFKPVEPRAFAVGDVPDPSDTQITVRGNARALGAKVPRGMVRVISWADSSQIPSGQSGRLELARWLAHRQNPLTARVTVNRIWQKLFGEGLVRSVDYFGTRGEKPSHPELLDYLAIQFMQGGWSQKRLIRSLVLSRTYRLGNKADARAIQIDPENRLLWRMNRQRLDAEAIRDSILAASGELRVIRGGPGMPLEFPENSSSLEPKAVNPPAYSLVKFRPEQEFQRTVYLPVIRSAQPEPSNLRDLFDFTQPAQIAGRRSQTIVPTQALFLLNNNLPRKSSIALAKHLLNQSVQNNNRLAELWLRVYNRPITAPEMDEALRFIDQIKLSDQAAGKSGDHSAEPAVSQSGESSEMLAWIELCHALLGTNEFIFRQ